jgi:predicted transcriptional regulator
LPLNAGPLTCRVREVREDLDIPAGVLAKALGWSATKLSHAENGCPVSPADAQRLAEFFGKSLDELWPATGAAGAA